MVYGRKVKQSKGKGYYRNYTIAARSFIDHYGLTNTPDGAKYTVKAVTSCLKDLAED
jgi:hypothetical protein